MALPHNFCPTFGEHFTTGPAPTITVEESSPTAYRVRFHGSGADVVSPNLRASPEVYNMNLSSTGSAREITLGKLILNVQNAGTSAIRLSLRAADTAARSEEHTFELQSL